MTTTTLDPAKAGHTHRFLMETLEAAMQRQPDVVYGERTVLGSCRCGATTQARAVVGTGYSLAAEGPHDLAA